MAPQPKGKQGTKGSKQIVQENVATLSFYRNMALGSLIAFIVINFIFFEFSTLVTIMTILATAILFGSYQFMAFMSKSKISESGAVLDSGTDLNMEGGIAEHVKDLIILTSGTILLTLISNYFWLMLILAPIRAFWMLWGSVLKPWLQQRDEQQPEVDEKKQRKMERRMKQQRMR